MAHRAGGRPTQEPYNPLVIVVLMGVAGTGKSHIGARLARALGCSLLDGDDLHPAGNIAKMARGEGLTDEDRAPWLEQIREHIKSAQAAGVNLVVACSALKRAYRQALDPEGVLRWVYLKGERSLIERRLRVRVGHFMKASMLDSQLAILEEPRPGEALTLEIAGQPDDIVARILAWLFANPA